MSHKCLGGAGARSMSAETLTKLGSVFGEQANLPISKTPSNRFSGVKTISNLLLRPKLDSATKKSNPQKSLSVMNDEIFR